MGTLQLRGSDYSSSGTLNTALAAHMYTTQWVTGKMLLTLSSHAARPGLNRCKRLYAKALGAPGQLNLPHKTISYW